MRLHVYAATLCGSILLSCDTDKALSVLVTGSGTVTSSPAGIDCGSACSASFKDGAQVQLTATPAQGWIFSGFTGACSGTTCTVTLSSDLAVGATFAAKPQEQDECAGLMPASLPAATVATLRDHTCLSGVSDELGNSMLGFVMDTSADTFPAWWFFTLTGGAATHIADPVLGASNASVSIYSQPAGFTLQRTTIGGTWIESYAHEGTASGKLQVNGPLYESQSSAVGIDPAGGTAVVRTWNSAGGWISEYLRLDRNGAAETGWVQIDSGTDPVRAAGVALSGHVLVLKSVGSAAWQARWLTGGGAPLTGWFNAGSESGYPQLQFLMDGSIALRFRAAAPPFAAGPWVARFEDGRAAGSAVPDWLAQRPEHLLYVVRNGAAYASWGAGSLCGDGLELIASSSGKSCGCLAVPNLASDPQNGRSASIGRDGSLIVPRPVAAPAICAYDLYPQLLK